MAATIPLVAKLSNDAVANGFVAGLNRSGGNLTEMSVVSSQSEKRDYFELVGERVPENRRIRTSVPSLTNTQDRRKTAYWRTRKPAWPFRESRGRCLNSPTTGPNEPTSGGREMISAGALAEGEEL